MEQTEEIIKAIETANSGGWMPIVTITTVFSLVITLLLVIWKMTWTTNNKRHNENEGILKGLVDNNQTMNLLLAEMRTTQKHQQKEIDSILK